MRKTWTGSTRLEAHDFITRVKQAGRQLSREALDAACLQLIETTDGVLCERHVAEAIERASRLQPSMAAKQEKSGRGENLLFEVGPGEIITSDALCNELQKRPHLFPETVVRVVRRAEAGGNLALALEELGMEIRLGHISP